MIESEFELVDQDGRTVRGEDLRGKLQLVFFGFTTCPDICPTTLTKITAALEELGADADALRPVLITVDPERDTRPVLKEYLASFDPRILGLTGTPEQVAAALQGLPGLRQQARAGGRRLHHGPLDVHLPDGQERRLFRATSPRRGARTSWSPASARRLRQT